MGGRGERARESNPKLPAGSCRPYCNASMRSLQGMSPFDVVKSIHTSYTLSTLTLPQACLQEELNMVTASREGASMHGRHPPVTGDVPMHNTSTVQATQRPHNLIITECAISTVLCGLRASIIVQTGEMFADNLQSTADRYRVATDLEVLC